MKRRLAEVPGSDGRRLGARGVSPLNDDAGTAGHKTTKAESPAASLRKVVSDQ